MDYSTDVTSLFDYVLHYWFKFLENSRQLNEL